MSKTLVKDIDGAAQAGLSRSQFRKLRIYGGGPPFVKIGRAVRYDPADIAAWLETQKIRTTGDCKKR